MVLSSLEGTLAKLNADDARHQQVKETLRSRMMLSENVTSPRHRKKSMAQSQYVFMQLVGEGRFGMVKLAKKKSSSDAKRITSAPKRGSLRAEMSESADYVAMRIIMRKRASVARAGAELQLLSTGESHAALMKQVYALRSLDHPGICREIETFEDSQGIYIAMEYYSGGHLLEGVQAPFDESKAAHCIREITSAMAHAHSVGVVHQDLRPENVHFATGDADARLVICDWSLCDFITAGAGADARRSLVKTDYSAPELDVGHRSDRGDMWSIGVMTYAILTLKFPFAHKPHDFHPSSANLPPKVSLSESCLDFITSLLRMEPTERLSAQEALAHPWLADAFHVPQEPQISREKRRTVTQSLLEFGSKNVLQRSAATLLAAHLSGQTLHDLTLAFQAADKNGDGTLDRGEVMEMLEGMLDEEQSGETASARAMKMEAILAGMDTDGSGIVSYTEFLAAAGSNLANQNLHLCWDAFREFDQDGSGKIDRKEIIGLLASNQTVQAAAKNLSGASGITVEAIKQQLKEYDENGDGSISFDEFTHIMMGKSSS